MVTILHISDLHRDAESRLTTKILLESLRLDRERYVTAGCRAPDVAIVSGDIVYGVKAQDEQSEKALVAQFDEALDFLIKLADLFFAGDRERIVLVPGNHDVSHPHVLRATTEEPIPAEPEKKDLVLRHLSNENSPWRWVWEDFGLRRISDIAEYNRRMAPFANFYQQFYQGRRTFALEPSEQLGIHDYPDLGIVVAGLCSCCENDLFNRSGRIHPDCIAGATRSVQELVKNGRVAIATWHHNLVGGPKDSDYVDADVLQSLIDGGYSIGMHGHQHRPQFLEHRLTADRKRAMAVISAGTLCGGPRSLPSGRRRAYNLVTIDLEARTGLLTVREMSNESFGTPVWGDAFVQDFRGATMAFGLSPDPFAGNAMQAAAAAEERLRAGHAPEALALLRPHLTHPLARRVAVAAFTQLEDWAGLSALCASPQSNNEIIALFQALYELGERGKLRTLLSSEAVKSSTDAAVRQCVEQARARLGGGN